MTTGHGCFRTSFISNAGLIVRKSDSLPFENAATVLCVYATAILAFINLGGLSKDLSLKAYLLAVAEAFLSRVSVG
jgi:NADPH:quinone reductase-like Zn-dependent oxidoreductase